MPFTVIEPLAQLITSTFTGWAGVSGTLVGWVQGPLVAALTVKLMWDGLNAVRGASHGMVWVDAILSSLRVVLVFWIALAAGGYAANVQGLVTALRADLTGLFVAGAGSGYAAIDSMMTKATASLADIFVYGFGHISFGITSKSDFSGVVAILSGFAMVTCMAIFAIIATVNLLFVDLSLALLFAIGPLFVAAFAFQATARFFDSWLGAVLKYVFTGVVITAITSMAIAIMAGYADKLGGDAETLDFVSLTFAALMASGVLAIFAHRAPGLAGDIVGGIGIHAVDLSRAAGPLGQAAAATGRTAGNAAAYGVGAVAGSSVGQSVANTSVGQAIASMAGRATTAASALSGSASNAYSVGKGAVGSISAGNDRPTGRPTGQ